MQLRCTLDVIIPYVYLYGSRKENKIFKFFFFFGWLSYCNLDFVEVDKKKVEGHAVKVDLMRCLVAVSCQPYGYK